MRRGGYGSTGTCKSGGVGVGGRGMVDKRGGSGVWMTGTLMTRGDYWWSGVRCRDKKKTYSSQVFDGCTDL